MMERRVKERLIGATLLIVLIVLIVPELLSGPRPTSAPPLTVGLPAPTRSVSVDLTTSTATSEPDLAEGSSAASPAPPPAAPAAGGSPGAQWDGPAAASAAVGGEAAPENAPPDHGAQSSSPTVTTLQAQQPAGGHPGQTSAAAGSTLETTSQGPNAGVTETGGSQGHRGWSVQLGSFASRTNAERLVHQLQARGGASLYVSASGSASSMRYRVRMGPLADRAAAEHEAGKLRAEGHPSTVVAPNS